MLKKLMEIYKNFEKKTNEILKYGLKFCFIVGIISLIVLITYNFISHTPVLYSFGILLFRLSLIFAIEFVVCSFIVDSIKKQYI